MSTKYSLTFAGCIIATLLLAGCGSGTTDQVIHSITPPSLADGPGGNFYGYYIQSDNIVDPITNVGGLYFSLPSSDGTWSGRMSFQFFDCQHTNVLSLNGQKLTAYLKTLPPYNIGTLDSVTLANPNTGIVTNFSGNYSRTNDNYAGDYTRVDKSGDDHRTVENCGSYTIADKGTWQVYKQTQIFPTNFKVTQTGDLLNWSFVATANKALIMIIDPAKVSSDNNALIRQIVTTAAPSTINLVNSNVTRGQSYLAVVELFDTNNVPVAFETLTVNF
jgi:hypothetical protein